MDIADHSLKPYGTTIRLGEFVSNVRYFGRLTLFVTGEPRKGKTELLKLLGFMMSCMQVGVDKAMVIFAQSLDILHQIPPECLVPGSFLLLDDMHGEDREQLIFSGKGLWKNVIHLVFLMCLNFGDS